MSTFPITNSSYATPVQAPLSLALRNLFLTFALTVSALAVAGYTRKELGYEMLIVAMGWPHVILGFLFYFGRVLHGDRRTRSIFTLLALVTLLFWIAHYIFTITLLIYVYFLYHAFRDEGFVYQQTRARHKLSGPADGLMGNKLLVPLLLLLISQPQDYRQNMRRVELTDGQFSANGWTLIPFKNIPDARGRDFYFHLQAPNTEGIRAFTTEAVVSDLRNDGEIRVADAEWPQASDLIFKPHYADAQDTPTALVSSSSSVIPVLLTGGHRVGQTFRAERDNLAGIWITTHRFEDAGEPVRFVFGLASPPLLPLSSMWANLRFALILFLSAALLWQLLPHLLSKREHLFYLLVFATALIVLQAILKRSARAGFVVPMIFQFVVVFHYFSWYVFSFDKLSVTSPASRKTTQLSGFYDRLLASLRHKRQFAMVVVGLSLLSAAGVLWFYLFNGPVMLRYAFDYNYFLYFLVLHVTFSFNPKQLPRPRL